jgi:indolepyruvate ferredoxin oxidoreductase beta subunit
MADNTKSILLVGVGGQGTILASKLLTTGLMQAGYDVKMSEIHGKIGRASCRERVSSPAQTPKRPSSTPRRKRGSWETSGR